VPEEVKEERYHRFMEKAQTISADKLQTKIGTKQDIIIDEVVAPGANYQYLGRTKYDAPEIDGVVHIETKEKLTPGQIINANIIDADEYDLAAKL